MESIVSDIETRYGKMTVTRGKKHTYVGIYIELIDSGIVTLHQRKYLEERIPDFGKDITTPVIIPAQRYLFDVNNEPEKLSMEKQERFHRIVQTLLFVGMRSRPDLQTFISFLCTRVRSPDISDWKTLKRLL